MKASIVTISAIFSFFFTTVTLNASEVRTDSDRLLSGQRMVYKNVFLYGSENANVTVQADGNAYLRLTVYDYNGNQITESTCKREACFVSWYAYRNAYFYIVIENLSRVYTDYSYRRESYY